jgi:hypothetical protein
MSFYIQLEKPDRKMKFLKIKLNNQVNLLVCLQCKKEAQTSFFGFHGFLYKFETRLMTDAS